MILAAVQPTIIGAVILNDIGPVIEREGLARISGYVGRAPLPHSWADAARMIRDLSKRHFPSVPEARWRTSRASSSTNAMVSLTGLRLEARSLVLRLGWADPAAVGTVRRVEACPGHGAAR